jgi:peroxin-1
MKFKGRLHFVDQAEVTVTLDSTFAHVLGIKRGSKVLLSQERRDVPSCVSVDITVQADDEELLARHKDSLEKDFLDRIRVVYPGARFPIWYNSYKGHITVEVSQTVPECEENSCLLLVATTAVNIHTASAQNQATHTRTKPTDTGDTLCTTGTSTSTASEDDGSSVTTDSSEASSIAGKSKFGFWDFFMGTSKGIEQDVVSHLKSSEPETPLNPLLSLLNYILPPGDQDQGGPHSMVGPPGKKVISSYDHPSLERQQPRHKKQPSLPVNLEEINTRAHINTPSLFLKLRVQPRPGAILSSANEACKLCLEGDFPGDFDAVVHPDTLPQVYHHILSQPRSTPVAFYVALASIPPPVNEYEEETEDKADGKSPSPSKPGDVDRSIVVRLRIQKTLHHVSGVEGEGPFLTESSVDSDIEDSTHHSYHKRLSLLPECASIKPGHVVVSDLVRQRLGAGMFSQLLMFDVQERDQSTCGKISVVPLVVTKGIRETKRCFGEWLSRETSSAATEGVPLTSDMVVLLNLERNNPGKIPCRIKVQWKKGPLIPRALVPKFTLLSKTDLEKVHFQTEKEKELTAEYVKMFWSSLTDLDPPLALKKLSPLGAFKEVITDCSTFLRNSFSAHLNHQQMGVVRSLGEGLLVCGVGEDYSSGCGRTSLVRHLCQSLMMYPSLVHCVEVDGTQLKNRRGASVRRVLNGAVLEAAYKQPSILFIDNLDEFCMDPPPVEFDAAGDGPLSIRATEYLVDMLNEARTKGASITLIAVSHSKSTLNPTLRRVKGGCQIFGKVIELCPPNLTERLDILSTCFTNRSVNCSMSTSDKREIARRAEGFSIEDLVRLVDRAIYIAEYKSLGKRKGNSPGSTLRHPSTEGCSPLRNTSDDPRESRADSVMTIVAPTAPRILLNMDNLLDAFEGYVPVALRGMSLNKSNSVDFTHVGGMKEAKKILTEFILWPSKYPNLFNSLPLKQQCGVLLYGPSGTGKTLLAQSVAKEFNLNFMSVKGPELLNKFIGASEQKVRDVFLQAQMAKPCVLFFDEFESLAPRRGHDNTGVTDRVVNQFLTQLDGIETLKGVYVVVASSRPDLIDPALLRPGRIDKKIYCSLPDNVEMVSILEALIHTNPNITLAPEVKNNLQKLVEECKHFTGADLKALLYNAQVALVHEVLGESRLNANSASPVFFIEGKEGEGQSCQSGAANLDVIFSEGEDDAEEDELTKTIKAQKELEVTLVPSKALSSPNSPSRRSPHCGSGGGQDGTVPPPVVRPQSLSRSISEPLPKSTFKTKLQGKKIAPTHGYFCPPRSSHIISTDIKGSETKSKIDSMRVKGDPVPLRLKKRSSLTPQFSSSTGTPGVTFTPARGENSDTEKQSHLLHWRHFMIALEMTSPSLSELERLEAAHIHAKFENKVKETIHDFVRQRASHS